MFFNKEKSDFKLKLGKSEFEQKPMLVKDRETFLMIIKKFSPVFKQTDKKTISGFEKILEKLSEIVNSISDEEIFLLFAILYRIDEGLRKDEVFEAFFHQNFEMNHLSKMLGDAFFLNKNIVTSSSQMGLTEKMNQILKKKPA